MMDPVASHVRGATDEPLAELTIGQALAKTVALHGDRLALVVRHQDISWSWRELLERTDRIAGRLQALGLTAGDRIGIWSPNNVEWVLTQFASARLGLILVTINPAYRSSELEHVLRLSGCKALVLAERFRGSDYVQILRSVEAPALRTIIVLGDAEHAGCIRWSDLQQPGGPAPELLELLPDDPINIQFTSGTTGAPKGATLTHRNILNNGAFVGRQMRLGETDRVCIPVPLYHCFGMVMGVLNCVVHGAAMVFPSEAFEPAAVLQAVEAERCTALYGVPTMFLAALEVPDFTGFDLTSLRTGIMAGAPCPRPLMERVVHDLHMPEVTICYGMTETSPVSFQTRFDAPIETRVGTVGSVHPHVEAKIVDPAGQTVPLGETGELLVRGYSVMRGYWNDVQRTAEAIDGDGWMHTGDLAILDGDGHARIVGRAKDMIIRGGENVYPAEVEAFLLQHPQVGDVAVFGIPCPRYGEQVCAWIRTAGAAGLTVEDIHAFCRDRIAGYKVPRVIRFVDAFPMTVTGKIQKFEMRTAMEREAG